MVLKQKSGEGSGDPKKRRRVGFANIDTGVEANECMKVVLVTSKDEVGDMENSFQVKPVDLNQFFGEDGKIYGYKDLKITIWLSMVSFRAYADIAFESKCDAGKGITDLQTALQHICGEALIEKEQFLQTFSEETNYIRDVVSSGVTIPCTTLRYDDHGSNTSLNAKDSIVQVIRMQLSDMPVGLLYSRLVPLVLLYIDGGSPVDVTDPGWDIYFVVKKMRDLSSDCSVKLLGFATVYRFYHYPDSTRLRIGQILVLPPYQGQGYGRIMLESVNFVAVSENVYDVTAEEPSDYLQYLRVCVDTHRLLSLEPIMPAINSVVNYLKEVNLSKRSCSTSYAPPKSSLEFVRQKLKINKRQFFKCWEVLLFLKLDPRDQKSMENFKNYISNRVRNDILDKDTENNGKRLIEVPNDYGHDMTFVVCRSLGGGEAEDNSGSLGSQEVPQEEQINELIEKQMVEISKIAKKVSLFSPA